MTRKEAADAARFELAQAEKQLQIFVLSELEKLSNRIFGEIETLTGQIDAARAAGESPLSFITRRNALRRIFDQVNLEVLRSAAALSSALTNTKRTAAKIAEQQIKESIELLTANVFDFDSETTRQIIELSADNKPLAVHFARIAAPVRQAIFDALSYGIATGQPAQKIAREIKAAARNSGAVRAMTIARTETNRAYRETTRTHYERIESVRGWQWQAALDLRTCPICWGMHGRIFAKKTPFATHPNCRCTMTPVFKGEKADYRQTGGFAFSQLNEAQQTAILGKRRFRLYQAGGIKLPDFVETKQTVFGLSRALKPVSVFDPGTE